ncbi:MerR family transcriptional regulator [Streptomyces sp. NPDC020875]|uniref:MerR family transcriptional regulator n=1 Tax=Streptomyces sp. NPDC020875 TaxID=3154898 RepID=UPI003405ECFF
MRAAPALGAGAAPDGPLITGALAATEAGVAPATIRKWVQLGHLTPAARRGRAGLYRLADVFAAERAARGEGLRERRRPARS